MKRKSSRVLLVLTLSFFLVSFIGMGCRYEFKITGDKEVRDDYPVTVDQLAEKLNIDPEEILNAFKDINKERKEKLKNNIEEKLGEAVEEGNITEEQKEAIAAKREEVAEELGELKGLPPGERIEAGKDIISDLKEWMKENDITFKELFSHAHIRPMRAKRLRIRHIFRIFQR